MMVNVSYCGKMSLRCFDMKAKVGDKIIITDPDDASRKSSILKGQIGKVVIEANIGCFATNPLWGDGCIGFINEEFEVLDEGQA